MNDAIKAFDPGDKFYHIGRIHSKLVTVSKRDEALQDTEYNPITIISVLNNLKLAVTCLIYPFENTKEYKDYLKSIDQCITVCNNYKNKVIHYEDIGKTFGYMEGYFKKLKELVGKRTTSYCEREYQNFCVPMYYLDKIYIRELED